jgi:hypothetical protein
VQNCILLETEDGACNGIDAIATTLVLISDVFREREIREAVGRVGLKPNFVVMAG